MSAYKVLLILGAGPGVGASVASTFSSMGYKVAVASRTKKDGELGQYTHVKSDLSDPSSLATTFAEVTKAVGAPSVVVYNAAALHVNEYNDPFALPYSDFMDDLTINTLSLYTAAQESVKAFRSLPKDVAKTFIYTGNRLNIEPITVLLTLGVGKAASAHIVALAAMAYKDEGFKFYFADQRKPDGAPGNETLDGPAHAEMYRKLAETTSQETWLKTFVKGVGYMDFGELKGA